MIVGPLALAAASAFAGACAYINVVEQPARLALEPRALLAEWKRSYTRGTVMQVSLAVLAAGLGVTASVTTHDPRWLGGAGLLAAILPYTLLGVMPTNRRLLAAAKGAGADGAVAGGAVAGGAGDDGGVRAGVRRWGRLHAVRTGLGVAAALTFGWALR